MISLLGAPDGLNIEGLRQALDHGLKASKDYLIKHSVLPFSQTGEPIPDYVLYFKRMKEGRVPPKVYKKIGWANHTAYDDYYGLKMANVKRRHEGTARAYGAWGDSME